MKNQTPEAEKPRPYRRPAKRDCLVVTTWLHPDAAAAVRRLMAERSLTASGAVHHLVRVAAGLPPLLP